MNPIIAIEELYTDGLSVTAGVSRRVNFHMKIRRQDGTTEWHYFGTVADKPGAIQHPDVLFPADFYNLPRISDILYSVALEVAVNLLNG